MPGRLFTASRDGKIPHNNTHLSLLGTLRVPKITTLSVDGGSVSEVTTVYDSTTGTLQNSIDTLAQSSVSTSSPGTAIISITDNITLTDLDFRPLANKFNKIVLRGERTVLLSDAVTAVNPYKVGDFGFASTKGWLHPDVATALTPSEYAGKVLYNDTNGYYFAVVDNDANTLQATAPEVSDKGFLETWAPGAYYGPDERDPFVIGDTIVVLDPANTLTCSEPVVLSTARGQTIEFEELSIVLRATCDIRSGERNENRLIFRGCVFDVNITPYGFTGPISAPGTLEGCSVTSADYEGPLAEIHTNADQRRHLIRSYFSGGSIASGDYAGGAVRRLNIHGCHFSSTFSIRWRENDQSMDVAVFISELSGTWQAVMPGHFSAIGCSFGSASTSYRQFETRNTTVDLFQCAFYHNQNTSNRYPLEFISSRAYIGWGSMALNGYSILAKNSNVTLYRVAIDGENTATQGIICSEGTNLWVDSATTFSNFTTTAIVMQRLSKLTTTVSDMGSGNGAGIVLQTGSSAVFDQEPAATFSTVASDNIAIGDNASISFATLNGAAAAVANDFGTASPQMCFAVIE